MSFAAISLVRSAVHRLAVDGGPVRLTVLARDLRGQLARHELAPAVERMASWPGIRVAPLPEPDEWDLWDAVRVDGVDCHTIQVER